MIFILSHIFIEANSKYTHTVSSVYTTGFNFYIQGQLMTSVLSLAKVL